MFIKKAVFFSLSLSAFFIFFQPASAATLSLEPSSGKFGLNSVFEERVMLTLDPGECINSGQIIIDFPNNALEVKDFDASESIFSLWIKKPAGSDFKKINQAGKISLIGGLPGGFCGSISPHDPNLNRSEKIGSIIFSVKKPAVSPDAAINFSSLSEIFLSGDQGDKAKLFFQNSLLEIDEIFASLADEWKEKLNNDKIPPESFTVELSRDENIFSGLYFISFSTVDKQTGVDHYEVLEISPKDLALAEGKAGTIAKLENKILGHGLPGLEWRREISPYPLRDQELKNLIKVKAVDKAGNERIVDFANEPISVASYASGFGKLIIWVEGEVIIILLTVIIFLAIKHRKRKKKKIK